MSPSCLASPIIYRPNHLTHLTFERCFKPLFLLHWLPTVLAILFASTASVCATVESSNPSALHHEFQRSQGTPPVHHPFCPVRVSVMGMSHDGHSASGACCSCRRQMPVRRDEKVKIHAPFMSRCFGSGLYTTC